MEFCPGFKGKAHKTQCLKGAATRTRNCIIIYSLNQTLYNYFECATDNWWCLDSFKDNFWHVYNYIKQNKKWVHVFMQFWAVWVSNCVSTFLMLWFFFFDTINVINSKLHGGTAHWALPIITTFTDLIIFQGHSSVKQF